MFAIVDVSRRSTRGQILMLVDEQQTATELALELNRQSVEVSVQAISAAQLDQFRAARAPAVA